MPTPEETLTEAAAAVAEFKSTIPQIKELIAVVQPEEFRRLGTTSTETAAKLTKLEKAHDDAAKTYEETVKELKAATGEVGTLKTQAKDLLERLDAMEAKAKGGSGGFGAQGDEFKTVGQLFAEKLASADFKDWRERMRAHESLRVKDAGQGPFVELKSFEGQPGFMKAAKEIRGAGPSEQKTDSPGLGTTTSAISILPYRIPGYVPLPARRLRIRDLMPVLNAPAPSISFLTQVGFYAGATTAVSTLTVGATDSGGTGFQLVSVLTATAHGWTSFDYIQIGGGTPAGVNGNFRIVVPVTLGVQDATHFSYIVPNGVATGAATGTIVALRLNNYGAAGETAEGLQKPMATMKFKETVVLVQVIAHAIAASRQILDDFPGLRSDVDNDLIYGLMRAEERKLLYASGSAPAIQGIMNVPGIQLYSWSQGRSLDTKIDAIRRALTRVQVAELEADGVVIHPIDFEDVETAKNTVGSYIWMSAQGANGEIDRIWRQPLVVTPAIQPGDFLVGAWQAASALYEKEQVNVRFTDSHSDYFTANLLAILAEERVAPVWKRPEAWVHGTFDQPPS